MQELARSFAQLESALREQAQTLEAVLALLALHPSDAYRSHLMQGLLGLQQQHSNCWLKSCHEEAARHCEWPGCCC